MGDMGNIDAVEEVIAAFERAEEQAAPSPHLCDVCNKSPSVGVYSSSMGAISFAYCIPCAQAGAEPYVALIGGLMGTDGKKENIAEWCYPVIEASLAIAGKTWGDLRKDIQRSELEYELHLLSDILAQVNVFVEETTVTGWTARQRREAGRWAETVLHGGSAERPDFLPEPRAV